MKSDWGQWWRQMSCKEIWRWMNEIEFRKKKKEDKRMEWSANDAKEEEKKKGIDIEQNSRHEITMPAILRSWQESREMCVFCLFTNPNVNHISFFVDHFIHFSSFLSSFHSFLLDFLVRFISSYFNSFLLNLFTPQSIFSVDSYLFHSTAFFIYWIHFFPTTVSLKKFTPTLIKSLTCTVLAIISASGYTVSDNMRFKVTVGVTELY